MKKFISILIKVYLLAQVALSITSLILILSDEHFMLGCILLGISISTRWLYDKYAKDKVKLYLAKS